MSIRVSRDLSLKERKLYTFGDFRGVDLSTSPYLVQKNRAISAENLIFENGTVRKRTGWKSLCKLPGEVNGLFSFELDDERFILVYAGTDFYLLNWSENINKFEYTKITNTCTYNPAEIDISKLVSKRIQLYVNKNKAYIVGCGDYLVFGKWGGDFELRRVFDNEDTYIPTTTINIDNNNIQDTNRSLLDEVNILSSFRYNEMIGVDADNAVWTVDTAFGDNQAIIEDSEIEITLSTYNEENKKTTLIINNNGEDKSLLYSLDNYTDSVGSVDFKSGQITLTINTKPLEEGVSNIIVKFKCFEEGQSDIVEKASVSALFGGNGNSNRLFLTGHQKHKNIHVWSEMYDYTYFPNNNYDELGSDSSAILGYVRATDGVLLAFKEKNGSDTPLYYISGTDTEELDANGDPSFITKFTKSAGSLTDTILSKYSIASLNGDNLILTSNGVKGIDLYENITTNAYRLRERSRNINSRLLREENLQEATAIAYKDKYYLSVNGVVYVCDSRFTYQSEEDIGDSFNYEWWYFTNVDARIWSEINNRLFFGNSRGEVCVFSDNSYADLSFQETEAEDILIDPYENTVSYKLTLRKPLTESSSIKFIKGDVYSKYLNVDELLKVDNNGYVYVNEQSLYKIYEGVEVYADNVGDTGLNLNEKYTIGAIDFDNLRFRLLNSTNNVVTPTSVGFNLCKRISNKDLYVTDIDVKNQEFKVREYVDGEVLDFVYYNNTIPNELLAIITFKENVVAKWYTPIYDLGSNMYSKTLLGITVTTEPLVKGSIKVGYQTRNIEKDFTTQGIRGFDFGDIDFEDFSFESSFTSSNTIRVKERNFNFIVLRYISDTETSCAVNGITIRYKINRLNKGVR